MVPMPPRRKSLEQTAREGGGRYQALFDCSPDAVLLTATTDGRVIAANPAACAMFGRTEAEMRRAGRQGLIDPEDPRHNLLLAERARTGRVRGEARFRRKDGSRFLVDINSVVLQGAVECPQAFVILRDVTLRREQEEALRRSAERLATIFENAGVGISEVDPDDRTLMVNDRQCAITGRTREELLGANSRIMWHPEDAPRCDRLREDLKSGRIEAFTDERRYLRPDGEVVWVRVNARRVPSPDGGPARRIAVVEEITERKLAERKLQESEEALRIANERLEAKIGERTRELAAGLEELQRENRLRLQSEQDLRDRAAQLRALTRELTLAEQRERRRIARILHDHLQQLLVSAKLQLACLDGTAPAGVDPVAPDVDQILSEAIAITRSLSAELSPPVLHEDGLAAALAWLARWTESRYGLVVDVSLPREFPEPPEDARILLFESVRELLFNAVKHAHVQQASLGVEVVEGELRIVVADEGPGFDPSRLTSAGELGGFGLFSIRERLQLIGGSMQIQSAPGCGARFTLILGLAGSELQTRVDKIRVLLVDDHAILREGLARLLGQEKDMEIVGQAGDGLAAVAMAEQTRPNVILMDISMPRLNGVEATRIIHARQPDIDIIGVSMYDDDNMAAEMRRAGACNLLSKSGPAGELKQVIRRCRKATCPA